MRVLHRLCPLVRVERAGDEDHDRDVDGARLEPVGQAVRGGEGPDAGVEVGGAEEGVGADEVDGGFGEVVAVQVERRVQVALVEREERVAGPAANLHDPFRAGLERETIGGSK